MIQELRANLSAEGIPDHALSSCEHVLDTASSLCSRRLAGLCTSQETMDKELMSIQDAIETHVRAAQAQVLLGLKDIHDQFEVSAAAAGPFGENVYSSSEASRGEGRVQRHAREQVEGGGRPHGLGGK